jgi:peptidoglycan/xylan/chitin deacetylase (PgdA/CDA1 family)
VKQPPVLTMGDGTVELTVHGGRRFRVRELVALRPCYRFVTGVIVTTVCVRDSATAKVAQTGRAPFRVPAAISRPGPRALRVTVRRADLMLATGSSVAKAWCKGGDCGRTVRSARVRVLRMDSCTARGPWLVRGAPRPVGKAVALTFDDGPGIQTESTLRMLQREGVPGTFFQVGVNIGSPNLERRILNGGHVLANHTYSHAMNPGSDQIARASKRIRKTSGFRPCLFRAPGGVNPPAVVATARSLGMVTVNWNVDPYDWRGSSEAAIVRVSMAQTRQGSILLYHDGAGNRAMVPAVRKVIRNLKAKGYRFLTVPELLQLPITYR